MLMFGRFAFARLLAAATICFALAASAAPPASADPTPKDVIKVYADIAQAAYGVHLDADMKTLGLWKGLCFQMNALYRRADAGFQSRGDARDPPV